VVVVEHRLDRGPDVSDSGLGTARPLYRACLIWLAGGHG
jgi:hypothetical protein